MSHNCILLMAKGCFVYIHLPWLLCDLTLNLILPHQNDFIATFSSHTSILHCHISWLLGFLIRILGEAAVVNDPYLPKIGVYLPALWCKDSPVVVWTSYFLIKVLFKSTKLRPHLRLSRFYTLG